MVETLGLNYLLVVLFLLVTGRPPSCAPRRLSLAGGVWLEDSEGKKRPCPEENHSRQGQKTGDSLNWRTHYVTNTLKRVYHIDIVELFKNFCL